MGISEEIYDDLFNAAVDPASKARLLAVATKESGACLVHSLNAMSLLALGITHKNTYKHLKLKAVLKRHLHAIYTAG